MEKIIEKLIYINILGAFCLDGAPVVGIFFKSCMLCLAFLGLFYHQSALKKFPLPIAFVFAFTIYACCLKEYVLGEWSTLLGLNVQTAVGVVLASLVLYAIYRYADSKAKRQKIIGVIAVSGIVLAIYTVIAAGQYLLTLHTPGMSDLLSPYGLQTNAMGVCWGVAYLCSLYLYTQKKSSRHIIYIAVNIIFLILSGSRKALIYGILGPVLYFLFSQSTSFSNTFRNAVIGAGLLFAGYTLIMFVPFFYDLVGYRIDSLFDVLRGGSGVDSTDTRMFMIEFGGSLIANHLWDGYGLNSFSYYYEQATGNSVYSHNNFIELMVSGGIVFTAVYYLRYLFIMPKLVRQSKWGSEPSLYLASLFVFILADVAAVTYYSRVYYIFVALAIACSYEKWGGWNSSPRSKRKHAAR